MAFFILLICVTLSRFYTLSPPLCYSLKITNYGMRKKNIFRIYGCLSVSRRNRVFRQDRIFRHTCMYKQLILTMSWNYNNFAQILYSYLGYTDRFLDVFLLLLTVILSKLLENRRIKVLITGKST